MTNQIINTSKNTGRLAGFLYVLLLPLGFFGMMYVPSKLVVPGDMATTISNILASESLFRLSMASSFLMNIDVIALGLVLYKLLKPVGKSMATFMVVFVLFGACISMLSELNHFAVLVLSSTDTLTVFTAKQSQYLVRLFLDMREYGSFGIAGIFWGLWLFPLGYLVFRLNFVPKMLGFLLIIAGAGYFIGSFVRFLAPHYDVPFIEFTSIGEMLFALWLLIKGIDVEQWKNPALQTA